MVVTQKSMIRFSVVYVNYHALGYIRDSIASLRSHHSDDTVEYVIVSNSLMESAELDTWTDRPTHLKIIQLEENHGFAYANNAGVKDAKGEFVFILNPDTLVHSPILLELESVWKGMENPGVIGPLTRYEDGQIQPTVKVAYRTIKLISYLYPNRLPILNDRHMSNVPELLVSQDVKVVGGSAMFLSKSRFEEVGGMDDELFLYWEEDDLCYRLRQAGYRVWYERKVEITHLESRIAKRENLDLQEIRYASKYHYLSKHHPEDVTKDAVLSVVVFFIRLVGSIVTFSGFRIRFNARMLKWHWLFSIRRFDTTKPPLPL